MVTRFRSASFVPKLPERKHRGKHQPNDSVRPYTQMMLCGLDAGLTMQDMRDMKYTHLMQVLYEWEDMHDADVEEVVDATSADVKALMRL